MALGFLPSDACVLVLQAAVVLAPRSPPKLPWLGRLESRAWALIPIGSIVGVIFAIRYMSATATGLTWLALIAVPLLAAGALGWACRGGRWWAAALAAVLFALAWGSRGTLIGEGAAALLSALSCVTLGVLLGAVTPPSWMKAGVVAMSAADVWLVASDLLQAPNNSLVAAAPLPGSHLPQLQSVLFGTVSLGYGDLFVAGLLGAVLARQARRQAPMALLTLLLASAFDVLFLVLGELPATVPVALALLIGEAWAWRGRRSAGRSGDEVTPAVAAEATRWLIPRPRVPDESG
ncbi:MAG: hypothetical protein ACRDMX_17550 [Solirubrobacteraceae bacterium]